MLRIAIVLSLLLVPALPAQVAAKPDALGIWRASLDGVPSAILTLADDSGEIGGTLVLYGIDQDTKKAAVMEAHTLIHPKLAGDLLTFEVRRPDAALMSFTVRSAPPKRYSTAPPAATIRQRQNSPKNTSDARER